MRVTAKVAIYKSSTNWHVWLKRKGKPDLMIDCNSGEIKIAFDTFSGRNNIQKPHKYRLVKKGA